MVRVTVLLSTPPKLAVTFIVIPAVAVALTVPVVLPSVSVRSVVSEFIHVTEVVMSCGVPFPGKIAFARNVTEELAVGLVGDAVSVIDVGVPGVTVAAVEGEAIVPKLAVMFVVQILETTCGAVITPAALIVAQAGTDEFQSALPVRSLVDPSLKVPVAVICFVVPSGMVGV
jgi:hypothetical protein